MPGKVGAAGGRGGGAGGGTMGRVAAGGGGVGAEAAGIGVAPPMFVVSFLGAMPGALMRTVSRFTIGVSSGFGGKVMRTVSFFGVEAFSAAGLFEGSSSAIKVRMRRNFYLTRFCRCQTFAPTVYQDLTRAPGAC